MKNVEQKLTPEQLARIQRNKEAAKLRLAQAQGRKFSQIINLIGIPPPSSSRNSTFCVLPPSYSRLPSPFLLPSFLSLVLPPSPCSFLLPSTFLSQLCHVISFLVDEEQKEATKPSGGSEDTVSIDEEGTIEMDKATLEELEKKEKESKGKGKEKEKEKEKKAKIPSPEDLLAWRRSQYKCKNNYVELKDIPTWKRALKTDEFLVHFFFSTVI
jgi:hypothetical protein